MRLAKVFTRALVGINAPEVCVEVHIANGLPALSIVGLPEAAVRESKDRVRSAILNSRFEFPARRITVNLAPADLPKEGGRYDLPIALGILAASDQLRTGLLDSHEFHGELALSGQLRPVSGSLPAALGARVSGRRLVLPRENAAEAALVENVEVSAAVSLLEICRYLQQQAKLRRPAARPSGRAGTGPAPDMADVRGQHRARRALEIAAAGRHNMLMVGPPGSGKSMLASRLPGILPPMTHQHALESAAVKAPKLRSGDRILTTPHPASPLSVAAPNPRRERFRWRITACCFWMNSRNSTATCWMCCASRWKQAASPYRVPRARRSFQPAFS